MRLLVASWPKIVAILVGGLGLSGLFSAWSPSFSGQHPKIIFDWRIVAISAALLLLSYLLASGREWARRILLLAVILFGAFLLLRYGMQTFATRSFTDLSPDEVPTIRLWTRLGDFSWFLAVLAFFAFLVFFLCHPNVVASFRRGVSRDEKV